MKKINRYIYFSSLFVALIISSCSSTAHKISKADKFYKNYDFPHAAYFYESVLKKDSSTYIIQRLAESHYKMHDYVNAELYYKKLSGRKDCRPEVFLNYGQVLKNVGKLSEAKTVFEKYSLIGDKNKGSLLIRTCEEAKKLMLASPSYLVKNEEIFNTSYSEFGITKGINKKNIIFTSDRDPDISADKRNAWNNKPFFRLYETKNKDGLNLSEAKDAKQVKFPLNVPGNNGLMSISENENEMVFTHIENKIVGSFASEINRPQLYFTSKNSKGKWKTPTPLPFSSAANSFEHPSFSKDARQLYFSSDMPGSIGKSDLWVSTRTGDSWGAPINLGSEINTTENEVFPFIRSDGVLFFSSDGHGGLGGLDIFTALKNEKNWTFVKNAGLPVNSFTDDFSVSFTDSLTKGYFSSDRPGGKGSDDVYSFVSLQKNIFMSGRLLLMQSVNAPAKNTKVMLLNNENKLMYITYTDSLGYFIFENLNPDSSYVIKLDENDPNLKMQKVVYLADKKDRIIQKLVINSTGQTFAFKNLPVDLSELPMLVENEPRLKAISLNVLNDDKAALPLANSKVFLKNKRGEVIEVGYTNIFGNVVFRNFNPDESYVLELDETDPQLQNKRSFIITNKDGKVVFTSTRSDKGSIVFNYIPADIQHLELLEVEDKELRKSLEGKLIGYEASGNHPLSHIMMTIKNEKGEIIETIITNNEGVFAFTNLPVDSHYIISLDENEPGLKKYSQLVVEDLKNRPVLVYRRGRLAHFNFNLLKEDDDKLSDYYVEDPWLKVLNNSEKKEAEKVDLKKDSSITIRENVYYKLNEFEITSEGMKILNKVIKVMESNANVQIEIGSHTDSRASDDYNLTLSKKRAEAAVNYIKSNGISTSRLKAIGFGETKPINKCINGQECNEDEHAKNRRTEFKIVYN